MGASKKKPLVVNPQETRGRSSHFDDPELAQQICDQAHKLCLLGATDVDLADFFCVAPSTIEVWKQKYQQFRDALTQGKVVADANVANRLYSRALGYSHEETHVSNFQGEITLTPIIKHYPPDTAAARYWLNNRRGANWADRKEFTGKNGGAIEITDVSNLEIARRMAFLLERGIESVGEEAE